MKKIKCNSASPNLQQVLRNTRFLYFSEASNRWCVCACMCVHVCVCTHACVFITTGSLGYSAHFLLNSHVFTQIYCEGTLEPHKKILSLQYPYFQTSVVSSFQSLQLNWQLLPVHTSFCTSVGFPQQPKIGYFLSTSCRLENVGLLSMSFIPLRPLRNLGQIILLRAKVLQ